MLSVSFVYLYQRFSMSPRIYDIACQIYHHLQVRGKGITIGITIEDACSTCTFLIDTFSDYITIFHSLPRPSY